MNKKVLSKIKKCLRLAQSSEAHEAAAAMRQAQKLMKIHGVNSSDLELSRVDERKAKLSSSRKINAWQNGLISMVQDAFAVEAIHVARRSGAWTWASDVIFIGVDSNSEIAAYCFDVLRRQLEKDRKEFILSLSNLYSKAEKTKFADDFCRAWVYSARERVTPLIPNDRDSELIKKHMSGAYGDINKPAKIIDRSKGDFNSEALSMGLSAGSNAQLNAGMNSRKQPEQISRG